MTDRIRIRDVRVLSDDWYLLKKTTFDFRRSNGSWQTLSRETYDRGNGAVVLLVNSATRTLILTRQFRYPAFVNGLRDGMLLEACAGLLDSEDPEATIRREVEEETGFRIGPPRKLFELYMSPVRSRKSSSSSLPSITTRNASLPAEAIRTRARTSRSSNSVSTRHSP